MLFLSDLVVGPGAHTIRKPAFFLVVVAGGRFSCLVVCFFRFGVASFCSVMCFVPLWCLGFFSVCQGHQEQSFSFVSSNLF